MKYIILILFTAISMALSAQTNITVSGLRALTSASANQEFYITDSGRQGFFRYDATDNSSVDDNGVIIVSGNGLRFKRLNFQGNYINSATDTVYVTWFGANGVDTTFDNTDIFEDIIGRNFKRIHIPDGIYRINFSSLNNFNGPDSKFRGLMLRANQTWTGNGTHRSVVLMDGVVNDNPSTYYSLFSGNGGGAIDTCDNVTFRGFTIRGKNYGGVPTNTVNEAIGIYQGWSASHFTVDSMKFEYIYGHGHADFATFGGKFGWNTVTNNIYLFNGKNGANLNTPDLIFTGNYGRKNIFSLLEAATGRAIIMNNIAEENDFIGISIGGHGDSLEAVNNGRYNIVANNLTFGNKQRGIHLAGGTSYSLVFNNTSYYNGAYGIGVTEDFTNLDLGPNQIATRNNYVFNNVSYDNGEVGNPTPMGIYLLASDNRIFNNTIYRTGALTWRGRNFDQKWGIISGATKGNHQIFNNTIYGGHSLGDYYLRVGNDLIWTDTSKLSAPHNPSFIVSVDPFGNNSPFSWTQVFGSLNMSAPTGFNNTLTGIDPNSVHTLRLAYNGGADSITFITTRPPTIDLFATDTTIVNSLANITLNSTASDVDGSIAGYQWHIMRRPFGSTSTLTGETTATATLTNVAYGEYYVMCEVTDDRGAKGVDYKIINVIQNISPIAAAGNDQTITLPTSQVTLSGVASSDPDGIISSYSWTKLTGTGGTITSPSAATTTVTGLSQGVYTFRLVVTDNLGATDDDTVQVVVNSGVSYLIRVQSLSGATLQAWITFDDNTLQKISSNAGSPLISVWRRNEIVDGVRRPVAYLRFQNNSQRIIRRKGE